MSFVLRRSWRPSRSAPGRESGDLRRLGTTGLMLLPAVLAFAALAVNLGSPTYGSDFHGGMWKAAHAILAGHTPYVQANASLLVRELNAFIPPPVLALLALPFAFLPWISAVIAWDLACLAAMLLALRLVGVRDWRLYALLLCSLPFVTSIGFGQPEGLLCLGVAIAWRWRDSWRGALAVGLIIAAKLIVWPLVLWLLATRRFREALIAATSAVVLLSLSWAVIGFDGLQAYPRLLAADAHAFAARTHSISSLLLRMGTPSHVAQLVSILAAGALAVAILKQAGRSDRGWFIAAIAVSLIASPLLEMHYLTLALIALAIARPKLDLLWLFAINVFWLSPRDAPHYVWQIPLVLAATAFILLSAAQPEPEARVARRSLIQRRTLTVLSSARWPH